MSGKNSWWGEPIYNCEPKILRTRLKKKCGILGICPLFMTLTLWLTNMAMENEPFEDVFPLPCWFTKGYPPLKIFEAAALLYRVPKYRTTSSHIGFFSFYPTTLPRTNIAPENGPSQKENSIPTIHFQVRTASFRGCK